MYLDILGAMDEELADIPAFLRPRRMGVGKVNAAIAATRILDMTTVDQEIVILIVGTSAAVDPQLKIGDVVIADRTAYHDVDVTALGFAHGQIPFEEQWSWSSDRLLLERTTDVCQHLGIPYVVGSVLTGDQFVSNSERVSWIRETFGASAIDMETAAIAQTLARTSPTQRFHWISIRVISDLADKSATVDFTFFLPQAAKTLSKIVTQLITRIRD